MNVNIEQINKYKITINGLEYDDFEKKSEWNGMIEFKSPAHGVIIVHKPDVSQNLFESFFTREEPILVKDFQVVKLSPSLSQKKSEGAQNGGG